MSASEESAVLSFVDELGVADLRVADAGLRTVAHGVGHLTTALPAGLYRLEARAGANTTVRLIELEPGKSYSEAANAAVASPAPLDGTTTSHEYHQEAAMQASRRLTAEGGTGVVLIVRDLRDEPGTPFEQKRFDEICLVRDGSYVQPLPWQIDSNLDVAAAVMPLPPGGHAIRLPLRGVDGAELTGAIEQAVSVIPGHQTMVFVPNTMDGPRFELASIALVQDEWQPWEGGLPGSLVAETILDGLRSGNPVVPEFDEQAIGRNLMLGVLAVHALVLAPDPDLDRAKRLAGLTQTQLFGGSDAAALNYVVEERRAQVAGQPIGGFYPSAAATAPPMLRTAYDALVRHDIDGGTAIADGSQAEVVAERLVNRGVWTTWLAERADQGTQETLRQAEPARPMPVPVSFPITLADIGSSTAAVQSLGPGARRVAGYLVSVAEAAAHDPGSDPIESVSERHVATACRLPVQAVRRAHEELSSMLVLR